MPRWLLSYEVESHLSIANDSGKLFYSDPQGNYEVHIRNFRVEPGSDPPLLTTQMIIACDSMHDVEALGEGYIHSFFHMLAFLTNSSFRVKRLTHIFDWSKGITDREGMYYEGFYNHDVPIPALSEDILETLVEIQSLEPQPRLRRAHKWFAAGVRANARDDQFAYFWFVIEIIAQIDKDPDPIPDLCPKCRSSLFCATCESTPTHRPYPKQAIEQQFKKVVGEKYLTFFKHASESRNRLMHGDEVDEIEQSLGVDFTKLTNDMGRLAWSVLLRQYLPKLAGKSLAFIETSQYVHEHLTVGAHVRMGFNADTADTDPARFPKLGISLVHEKKNEN